MPIAGLLLLLAVPAHATSPSAVGDVTITEFQADPTRVPQYYGEWFELYNNYPGTLDFDGVSITNGAGQTVTVTGTHQVASGQYLVLGINQDRTYGSATYNGNVPVDYVYNFADFNLALSDDTLTVRFNSLVLDTVDWTSAWGISSNYAHSASLNAYELEWANDYSINWCSSATFMIDSGMYGSPGEENEYCGTSAGADNDGDGYSEREGDCRDDDANIHPESLDGADGVPQSSGGGGNPDDDADCDGNRDDGVTDDDGDGYSEVDGDCNDADGDVFPGAVEDDDSLDNDCNGCIDDLDEDGDGYGYSESDSCGEDCSPSLSTSADPDLPPDRDADVHPGATEVPYDGYDQDCDGFDLCDYDEDGYNSALCICGTRCDCDDNNSAIHPGAPEDEEDGIDNDCDGDIDIPDRDGDGFTVEDGDCMDIGSETGDVELVEVSATVNPDAVEKCNGLDDDCDGFYDNISDCSNPAAYARVRGGGLCGVSPATGGAGTLALAALMGLAAIARRREGGAQ
ncbi:MAG: MopE-related protein [Pseudomonadota bacterium]|nr:MopE-related protein [Pseudomonadota bacterium]